MRKRQRFRTAKSGFLFSLTPALQAEAIMQTNAQKTSSNVFITFCSPDGTQKQLHRDLDEPIVPIRLSPLYINLYKPISKDRNVSLPPSPDVLTSSAHSPKVRGRQAPEYSVKKTILNLRFPEMHCENFTNASETSRLME